MTNQDGYTIKDKAKSLVEKFIDITAYSEHAKRAALICCDEIINYEFFGSHTQNYWKGIKKEIEKL